MPFGYNAVDLVNLLEREKLAGKTGSLARKLIQVDVVIIGELGYLPFPESGGALLFHLISQLYERTSLIMTTEFEIRGMGTGVRRCQDDNGLAGSSYSPL